MKGMQGLLAAFMLCQRGRLACRKRPVSKGVREPAQFACLSVLFSLARRAPARKGLSAGAVFWRKARFAFRLPEGETRLPPSKTAL
ncbi:hypothetical protein [Ottowia sp. oral taxon 894]|uniref:hypothetical protein n=1 Tax=Ottowia sp. oral taxon 894 TaxID=1658672 RepID=UPI0012E1A484|nr:hypothetical protein [Ottowia sp. oral taxon 894]